MTTDLKEQILKALRNNSHTASERVQLTINPTQTIVYLDGTVRSWWKKSCVLEVVKRSVGPTMDVMVHRLQVAGQN